MTAPLLQVRDLNAWYGKSHILTGVSLEIGAGEIVGLVGRNGAGRSTICKAIMGQLVAAGEVSFQGRPIMGLEPHQVAQAGIGHVPENREIFPTLTTAENLSLGRKPGQAGDAGRWPAQRLLDLFPNLRERADVNAGALSGGEQQMLAICRTLVGDPDLVMIDEPTEGLSPQVTATVAGLIREIAAQGCSVLLVEQKLAIALDLCSRLYVVGQGSIVFSGTPSELMSRDDVRRAWLEVA